MGIKEGIIDIFSEYRVVIHLLSDIGMILQRNRSSSSYSQLGCQLGTEKNHKNSSYKKHQDKCFFGSLSYTPTNRTMTADTTRILVIGGSFGGMSFIKKFIELFRQGNVSNKTNVEIYLIEPRAGFINLLGIPRAIIDDKYARVSYMNAEKLNINFASVQSSSKEVIEKLNSARPKELLPENLKVHFIHGKCTTFIDEHNVHYQVGKDQEMHRLSFDYCVFSTGRRRRWPFDPVAHTEDQYAAEMQKSKEQIERANVITVIGGGALGIEVAGEIKQHYGHEKKVRLVHPHPFVPPEIYSSKNFKEKLAHELEESGVELAFNTRIEKELENGNLLTTDGRTLDSELNLWCNYHKNNIEPLLPAFESSIERDRAEVIVDERMVMQNTRNIFVIGDVINLRIIKTCGGAYHQGQHVSQSLYNIIVNQAEEYDSIDLSTWPHGMTIVVGTDRIITQWDDIGDGKVVYNDENALNYYSDYGSKDFRVNMQMEN